MANNEVFNHDGLFETIEADFNNETGNIAFRATFPNPEGILRHGETGTILLPAYIKNALLIPQEATFDILDKKFVFVVDMGHFETNRYLSSMNNTFFIYHKHKFLIQNIKSSFLWNQ